jgi:hypothetical protein
LEVLFTMEHMLQKLLLNALEVASNH